MKLVKEEIMNIVEDVDKEINKLISKKLLSIGVTTTAFRELEEQVSVQINRIRDEVKR